MKRRSFISLLFYYQKLRVAMLCTSNIGKWRRKSKSALITTNFVIVPKANGKIQRWQPQPCAAHCQMSVEENSIKQIFLSSRFGSKATNQLHYRCCRSISSKKKKYKK